ncbi:hypothetical protein ACOMHN_052213 [Nucella lapillus]
MLTCGDNVPTMTDHSGDHNSPNSQRTTGYGPLDIHDGELFHLPDIQVTGNRPEKPGDSRQNSLASKSFDPVNLMVDIKIHEGQDRTLSTRPDNSHEKTYSSKCCALPKQVSKSDELAKPPSAEYLLYAPPYGSPRLMASCRNVSHPTLQNLLLSAKGFSRSQTQLHKLDTDLLPEKFKPYKKSLSQREFSIEEKKNTLPDIVTNKTRNYVKISRSSSAFAVLPPLPGTLTCHMSNSQPDMLTSCRSSTTQNSCTPLLTRVRMRNLWKIAFEKLRLLPKSEEDGDMEDESWILAPGDVLRPVYSRWNHRRDALAEPERMCMPQVLREQIQKDVRSRKRSMKRKLSKFLNVKLGLNLEEDLAA